MRVKRDVLLVWAVLAAMLNTLAVWFVSRERCIAWSDLGGYWTLWIEFARSFFWNVPGALRRLYWSMNALEYNYLAVLPLVPVYTVFGGGRLAYVLALLNGYALPATTLFAGGLLWRLGRDVSGRWFRYALVVIMLGWPHLYAPLLRGYPDVLGLGVIAVVLCFAGTPDDYRLFRPARAVGLALLLLLLVFVRRWYAFWVVGFLLTLGAMHLVAALRERGAGWRRLLGFAGNMAVTGLVALAVLWLWFRPFLLRGVGLNYREIHAGYRQSTLLDNFLGLVHWAGPLPVAAAALGLVWGFRDRSPIRRQYVVLAAGSGVLAAGFFFRVQSMGIQHRYLVVPSLLVLLGMFLVGLFERCRAPRAQVVATLAVAAYVVLAACKMFVPHSERTLAWLRPLLGRERCYPLVRGDLPMLERLAADIEARVEAAADVRPIYVLASSEVLNEDCLRRIHMPKKLVAFPHQLRTAEVDRREDFPNAFLAARYVVVGRPVQLHMRAEEQQVIGTLAEPILSGTSFGRHYRRLAVYPLDGGVTAELYERVEPWEAEDVEALSARLRRAYPDKPALYTVSRVFGRMADITLGDEGGEIRWIGTDSVFLHPGARGPSAFTLRLDGRYRRLVFTATFDNLPALAGRPATEAEVGLTVLADGREMARGTVTPQTARAFELPVTKVREVRLQVDAGAHGPKGDWFLFQGLQLEVASQDEAANRP